MRGIVVGLRMMVLLVVVVQYHEGGAHVTFESPDSASKAVEMSPDLMWAARNIKVACKSLISTCRKSAVILRRLLDIL